MANRKSLGRLLTVYAIIEIIYTLVVLGLCYFVFQILINAHLIYPANYGEQGLAHIQEQLQNDSWTPEQLPFYYDYIYKVDGQEHMRTIDPSYNDLVQEAEQTGMARAHQDIVTTLKDNQRELILLYKLRSIVASEQLHHWLPNFEWFYIIVSFSIWVVGFVLIVKRSIRILKLEIQKIARVNAHLKEMNLHYSPESSHYREISELLEALDSMSHHLEQALIQQWTVERQQQDLIESVTHDVRTPITLIKGNLELLKESLAIERHERVEDIEDAVERLEMYIYRLSRFNHPDEEMLSVVDEIVVAEWLKMVRKLCRSHQRQCIVTRSDRAIDWMVNSDDITTILQNLIVNAVEHSEPRTGITLQLINTNTTYKIVIQDEGTGFDSAIIAQAQEKYKSSKSDTIGAHGLGLYIVQQLVQKYNGQLHLNNYTTTAGKSGAIVICEFNK